MTRLSHRREIMSLGLCIVITTALGAAPAKPKLPTFDAVQKATLAYFAEQPNFSPDQIISQSQVRGLFTRLKSIGWVVPDQERILNLVPGDSETLVQYLRTPDGRKFSRQIAPMPHSYDRLDRLIRMPTGRSAVARLIKGPGGPWMLKYMTEDAGGAEMGRMLSNTPTGKNFNQPTGRIYMLPALISQLKDAYQGGA